MTEMNPESHYTPRDEMDVYMNWANELCKQDPEFAETLIRGIVSAEFPKLVLDAESI